MENKYQLYKGVWYKFSPKKYGMDLDVWELSSDENDAIAELKIFFNSNRLRIDECLTIFKQNWEDDAPNRNYGKNRK